MKPTQTELEAAAFRTLVAHLRERADVQNIDMMNLAGFCRNCLSKWYRAAAEERGMEMSYEEARELIYGMPYGEWKAKFQNEATAEQLQAFAAASDADN
ncbi:MAG: DUF1244 domain-containing protein [Gammaproteobacteria bacterium]|nr:MAG: DUF1244 domain-containing protein [Gammaproteobacteria bacterium]